MLLRHCYYPLLLAQADLNINAGSQVQTHQRVNCFISWLDDVYQTLVSTNLILVTCIFIYVRRCQYCVAFFASRQRNWTADLSTSTFRCFDDFSRRLIDQLVIERFQANTNSLIWHRLSSNRKNKKIHLFTPFLIWDEKMRVNRWFPIGTLFLFSSTPTAEVNLWFWQQP